MNDVANSIQTIAGGSGAGPHWHGTSGVHTHITNTRIGDVEILERRYPVLLHEFSIRDGSGGEGEYNGGCGVTRDIEFLQPIQVSILSEVLCFPSAFRITSQGILKDVWMLHSAESINLTVFKEVNLGNEVGTSGSSSLARKTETRLKGPLPDLAPSISVARQRCSWGKVIE
jgi:Hydantoinase B/oxoprolinase